MYDHIMILSDLCYIRSGLCCIMSGLYHIISDLCHIKTMLDLCHILSDLCRIMPHISMLWPVLAARQEESSSLERKLDYEELTPCLREVTKVWEDLLTAAAANPAHTVPYDTLLDCVKKGSILNWDTFRKNADMVLLQPPQNPSANS